MSDAPHDAATGGGFLAREEPGRKGEILDAALEVFSERGYDGGSMREIASRVGVSEPALYRHFPGKEALFITLLKIGTGRLRDETLAMIEGVRAGSLRQQMVAAIRDRRSALQFYAPLLRVILPAAARHERILVEYRAQIVEPVRAKLTQKAERIDAELGVENAAATRAERVRALMSLIIGYMVSSFVIGDELDEAIVDAAIRVMGWEDRPG